MLKEIRLKNWKSFGDATLYIDPLTVLIGTNASGKSNAVDAIEFLGRAVRGKQIKKELDGGENFSGIRGGSQWAALKPGDWFNIEALLQGTRSNEEYLYGITVQTGVQVNVLREYARRVVYHDDVVQEETIFDVKLKEVENGFIHLVKIGTRELAFESFLDAESTNINVIKALVRWKSETIVSDESYKIIQSIIDSLTNLFILDPIPINMRDFSSFSETLLKDASNLAGVLASLPPERKSEIENDLLHYVTQLPERDIRKVWAQSVGLLQKDAMLYCEEEWSAVQPAMIVDAKGMSDGTLRFLGILTALLTRPKDSLIVIEEVDNGLHPSRTGLLLKMLKEIGTKRNIDILVTTHNPALLDAIGPDMVPFVMVAHRDPQVGQSKLTLLEDLDNLLKLLASGPLGRVVTQGKIEESLAEGMETEQ